MTKRHYWFLPPSHVTHAMTRRKPLHQHHSHHATSTTANDSSSSLHRTLTATDLMLYGVGCSVGAGIYCLVGIGAQLAGPAIALSFLLCGTACIFTSLPYAEFAARIPITGSAYVYAYVAFGEYCGWLVGWFLTLGYGFTASVVARSWAAYVASFLQVYLPFSVSYLTKLPLGKLVGSTYTCSPLSIVIVALCTWVLVSGAKESSRFNNFMTVLNISVLLFVVVAGILFGETDNLEPFAPHGMQGVAKGAGLVFFAFIGFDMVACLSEEVVEPERNMPIGIVGSLVVSATIYVSVSLAVIGMAPIPLLGQEVPIVNALIANACCTHVEQLESDAADQCLNLGVCAPVLHKALSIGGRVVSFGAIFGLTTGTFTSLMGQPRIFYRMAQDGLLFRIFGVVNPTTRVPTGGIVITGIVASMLACFIELESLANMISLGTLMVFTFVDAGVLILRWSPSIGGHGGGDGGGIGTSATTSPNSVVSTKVGDFVTAGPVAVDGVGDGGRLVAGMDGASITAAHAANDTATPSLQANGSRAVPTINAKTSHTTNVPRRHHPSNTGIFSLHCCHDWFVRFRGHDVSDNGMKPIVCVALFTLSSLLTSVMMATNKHHRILPLMSGIVALVSALLLSALPQSAPPKTFSCPLVPLVPLTGIASNTVMMGSLPLASWTFVVVWLAIGNIVYFSYGIRHSRLGKEAPPVRMLSLPESLPLVASSAGNGDEGELMATTLSYQSTNTAAMQSAADGLEHRTHPHQ